MKSVSHIFGGQAKVKVMRLFVFNPDLALSPSEVAHRTKERIEKVRHELSLLFKAGLIRKRPRKGYILDRSYLYLSALEKFLIEAAPISTKEIVRRVSKAGNIKLILIAGVFLHNRDSRVDILIAGDHLKQSKLLSEISIIEARLGKELRYAAFETSDFTYRMSIYDKFIRDILDYPHQKILNKIGI